MKKMMSIIAAAIMMTTAAYAQSENENQASQKRPDRTEMLKQRTDRMAKTYGLNDEQTAQLLKLNTTFADKMPAPRGPRGMGRGRQGQAPDSTMRRQRPTQEQRQARIQEMRANFEAYNAELKKIMTSEQYEKYSADLQQRMQRRGGQRSNGGNNTQQN